MAEQVAIPGILGGLGPAAHIKFEEELLKASKRINGAVSDQEHPEYVLFSATSLPDRTKILNGTEEEKQKFNRDLVAMSGRLAAAGAGFMCATCNTVHAFQPDVRGQLAIPWMSMIELVAEEFLADSLAGVKKVGILATDGTLKTELYQRALNNKGIEVLVPSDQGSVMDSIYHKEWGVKATGDKVSPIATETLARISQQLISSGAEVIIAGCTEISVAFIHAKPEFIWVDPLEVLARGVIEVSYGKRPLVG